MTLCPRWAWNPDDQMKSLRQCIQTLVRVVGGDGNLLLDVGPMADGRIEPGQVARLKEMGQWLHSRGESILACVGDPLCRAVVVLAPVRATPSTFDVMSWPEDTMILPPMAHRIIEGNGSDRRHGQRQTDGKGDRSLGPEGPTPRTGHHHRVATGRSCE